MIAGEAEPRFGLVQWPTSGGRLMPFTVNPGAPHGQCAGVATPDDWSMSCRDGSSAFGDHIRLGAGRGAIGAGVDSLGRSIAWKIEAAADS